MIVYGQDRRVCEWVMARTIGGELPCEKYTAIGAEENGELYAGCVYERWTGPNIWMHIAGEGHWCTHENLFAAFRYPFLQLNCRRVTAQIGDSDRRMHKLLRHLGFQFEGRMRHAYADDDAAIYGLLRSECKWL